MNEQGLSRSEILEVLSNAEISRVVEPQTEMGILTTDDWLQTKVKGEKAPSVVRRLKRQS